MSNPREDWIKGKNKRQDFLSWFKDAYMPYLNADFLNQNGIQKIFKAPVLRALANSVEKRYMGGLGETILCWKTEIPDDHCLLEIRFDEWNGTYLKGVSPKLYDDPGVIFKDPRHAFLIINNGLPKYYAIDVIKNIPDHMINKNLNGSGNENRLNIKNRGYDKIPIAGKKGLIGNFKSLKEALIELIEIKK
jgi:hypothetical protein